MGRSEYQIESTADKETLAGAGTEAPALPSQLPSEVIGGQPIEQGCPLSFGQQRLWFLDQLEPGSSLYNMPSLLRLTGAFDRGAFEKALNALASRHEALRTHFVCEAGEPRQIIEEEVVVPIRFVKSDTIVEAQRDIAVKLVVHEEMNRPFDLAKAPLIRALLIRQSDSEHLLLLCMHHIISDEWSLKIIFKELGELYGQFSMGKPATLAELPVRYVDHALWQRNQLAGESLQEHLSYWKKKLGDDPPLTEFPATRGRKEAGGFRGSVAIRTLRPELTRELEALARNERATLFIVLLAAFKALLYRYTSQPDLIVASPMAGRTRIEVENVVGFFINTVLLRTDASGDPEFTTFLKRVRNMLLEAYAHQDLPLEKLVQELQPERSLRHLPFTRLMFMTQQDYPEKLRWEGLQVEFLDAATDTAKFDLTVNVQQTSSGLVAHAEYNTDLFDEGAIGRLLSHYENILVAIASNPASRLSRLSLLTEAEAKQLLQEWNDTAAKYPRDRCIHQIFEEQTVRTPDAIALEFEDSSISYRELNERSNQLAHYLRRCGVGQDAPVGLCLRPSPDWVVAMLGILKAGGAYVPLDPDYPRERLSLMVRDTQPPVLLTEQDLRCCLPETNAKIICVDSDWDSIARESNANLSVTSGPESLAYVMFTSGSTGQPKGVMVPHRAVNRLVLHTNYIALGPDDRIGQISNVSFDAATFEVWGALLNGGRLVGISTDIALSPRDFGRELRDKQISAMFVTAALFNQVAREAPDAFGTVRTLIAGGEALDPKWVWTVLSTRPPERLINGYGPTENTTFTCCHHITQVKPEATNIPIGRPIANTQVYLLDRHLNPVPIGVSGELYAGGDGLALGYWNRPDLTAEKFIPNPFSHSDTPEFLYRTGDLARYLPNGEIEFLGRLDDQVKVRGFRIEPGEVEIALRRHEKIADCVVRVCGNEAEEKRLVAYVVPSNGELPNVSQLRNFLLERLPHYMVPSTFVELKQLSLTPNGKLDRRKLPAPEEARPKLARPFEAPRDAIESKLAEIFQRVLQLDQVGIHDRFFDLGGHSLLAVQVIALIEKALGKKLLVATIFHAQTIEELGAILRGKFDEAAFTASTSIVPIQAKGSRPPLFLVHGAGGGMFWGYVNLSKCLGPDQPIYAFRSRGLDGREELPTIEQIAETYVADLKGIQPAGPYYLGGYCFGGNVAYEMARQLKRQGHEVALLALLNCSPPNSRYTRVRLSPAWVTRFFRNGWYWIQYVRQWTPNQRREFFKWKLDRFTKRLQKLRTGSQAEHASIDVGDLVDLSAFSPEERRVWESHIRALLKYSPAPYDGQISLLRSPGHPLWCSYEEDYGWGELAKGGVTVTIVPGAHEKILEEPCVASVAQHLHKLLALHKPVTRRIRISTTQSTELEAKQLNEGLHSGETSQNGNGQSSLRIPVHWEAFDEPLQSGGINGAGKILQTSQSNGVKTRVSEPIKEPTLIQFSPGVENRESESLAAVNPAITTTIDPPGLETDSISGNEIETLDVAQFWKQQLEGAPELIELPTDFPRPARQSGRISVCERGLPAAVAERIEKAGGTLKSSEVSILIGTVYALLRRYSRQEDIVIGLEAGQGRAILPLRLQVFDDPTFEELVTKVVGVHAEAAVHGGIAWERLIEEIQPARDESYQPICQIAFSYDPGAETKMKEEGIGAFDLVFQTTRDSGIRKLRILWAQDLFEPETIERMLGHWEMLLRSSAGHPQEKLSRLKMLTLSEEQTVLFDWNGAAKDFCREKTLGQLFLDQARRTPETEALVAGTTRMTYRQLAARAITVANELRAAGIGKEMLVGICLERSWEMIAGILGTLLAGAAYVPMDPAYPAERIAFMLDDAKSRVLLTQRKLVASLPKAASKILCVEDIAWPKDSRTIPEFTPPDQDADGLAYVIYTSGSTGQPKGVALEHRNAVAFVCWAREVFSAEELNGVLASTSICFDLSIFEMFVPLSWGGKLVLVENALALATAPVANEVRLINTVPSAIRELLRLKGVPSSVRVVNLAGEPLATSLVNDIYSQSSTRKVYDLYGPTETTTYSTFTLRQPNARASIGRPLANEQIYLLDGAMQPVPIGVPGDLYIGGAGVARGYLGRPELTAGRFLKNPFRAGERMYKTGDLARWRNDGNLEFLGRTDHQVKIRGFRIELGEIEAILKKQPGVADAVVVAREDQPGDKRLVAYIATGAGETPGAHESELAQPQKPAADHLIGALRKHLPAYMTPAAFVFLETLPQTPNGKIDRKRLPVPDYDRPGSSASLVAPRTATEERILAIWNDVLQTKHIGVADNFFDLGGNSLLAIQVISRLREQFGIKISLTLLFEAPTIEALASGISSGRWHAETAKLPPLGKVPRNQPLPVSFVQERLWFLDQLQPEGDAHVVPAAFRFRGPIDLQVLQQALNEIVKRHEALRTTFAYHEGALTQVIAPELTVDIEALRPEPSDRQDPDPWAIEQARNLLRKPFDLSQGPLIRARLLSLQPDNHVLVVVMHHTVADGWSLDVFFRELRVIYEAIARRQSPPLPALPIQYADFAAWKRECLQGPLLQRDLEYWKQKLAGAPAMLDLPADFSSNVTSNFKADAVTISFDARSFEKLNAICHRDNVTVFMTLLTGLAITLRKWTGQEDLVIGTVVAGRNHREIENLIGCFINFLPLRISAADSAPGSELIRQVRATVNDAQDHQDCPFERIVEEINPERKLNQNPLYNVAFLLQDYTGNYFENAGVRSEPFPISLEAALLDLRFEAVQRGTELSLRCEYRRDLFAVSTITNLLEALRETLERLHSAPDTLLKDFAGVAASEGNRHSGRAAVQTLAISSTFTAEPLAEPLKHWMKELGVRTQVEFAPFNQVFQQLLDTSSLLGQSKQGLNLILLRVEDWEPACEQPPNSRIAKTDELQRNAGEFVAALKSAAARGSAPYLVCLCPSARNRNANGPAAKIEKVEKWLEAELRAINGIYALTHEELFEWYPVVDFYDPSADELGRVPYTPVFFTALATAIVRKYHALNRPPVKVVALDCDNTLWTGVCGEDGPEGIRLDASRVALQQFMRKQVESGVLLCACSKNNEQDVREVFHCRKDMPLRSTDFTAWKLNWQPKSENLKALARELNLGLDSFVFVDDNPVECAEVEASCPGVQTLLLPEDPEQIPQFLKHCWIFDHLRLTTEDRGRAAKYRENQQREKFREESPSLVDFLAGLDLQVAIDPMKPEQLARTAQLTQRTNQFNCTTRRRSESEIQNLLSSCEVLTVSVSDRFGDYGLTGVMICQTRKSTLEVDSFLLSCRVLGRGIEHRMLARAGEIAQERGLGWVDIHFVPSPRNQPAHDFLESVGGPFRQAGNGGLLFRFPARVAAQIQFDPQIHPDETSLPQPPDQAPGNGSRGSVVEMTLSRFRRYREIGLEFDSAQRIHERFESKCAVRQGIRAGFAAPRDALEQQLCELWQKLLRVSQVGVKDNFFELGGHSLLAVRLFSEIEKMTGSKLPLVTIFQSPTIRQLARALSHGESTSPTSLLVPLQPKGSKAPLFLVHGAGGDVLWGYANLSAHLPADQPVYGIKSRGQAKREEFETLEAMAECYLKEIRGLQPHGPYYLGGYCFGGNVAYEMARQLKEQGEEIALLLLLDSAPSNAGYERIVWWRPSYSLRFARNLVYWLQDFVRLPAIDRRRFVLRKGRSFARKLIRKLTGYRPAVENVDLEEVIDPAHFPENELKLWKTHLHALEQHVQKAYSGPVVLMRTQGQPLFSSLEEDFCWGKLVTGGVEVCLIPGSHENVFMEPNVRALADRLAAHLDRGGQKAPLKPVA